MGLLCGIFGLFVFFEGLLCGIEGVEIEGILGADVVGIEEILGAEPVGIDGACVEGIDGADAVGIFGIEPEPEPETCLKCGKPPAKISPNCGTPGAPIGTGGALLVVFVL